MSTVKEIIGETIKVRREFMNMNQVELAEKAGKRSATYIALIEQGKRNVSIYDLIKIAHALGTTVSHLIGENTPTTPDIEFAVKANVALTLDDKKCLLHILRVLSPS